MGSGSILLSPFSTPFSPFLPKVLPIGRDMLYLSKNSQPCGPTTTREDFLLYHSKELYDLKTLDVK